MDFSHEEMQQRITGLQAALAQQGLAAALILHPRDLYYYAGVALHGQLVVPAQGAPVFLVQLNLPRAQRDSWIGDIRPSLGNKSLLSVLKEKGLTTQPLGVEADVLPAQQYLRLQGLLPEGRLVDISDAILSQRAIKSPAEVSRIQAAADMSAEIFAEARRVLKGGMSELEGHGLIYAFGKTRGMGNNMVARPWNQGNMEPFWLAAGPNSTAISGYWLTMCGEGITAARPYGPTHHRLQAGDLICMDGAFNRDGYHADEARTFVVGEPTQEQRERHAICTAALDAAIAAVKPGARAADVYRAAKAVYDEAGLGGYFMTLAYYDLEYVGHGLGLEVAEPPNISPKSDEILQPGMIIALEPKFMIPGWGGMTVEDTVVVTDSGTRILTRSPRDLSVLPL